jgi:hypothetical protein
MRILIIGDIVGRPGRRALAAHTNEIRSELGVDLFIANAENCAGGSGITPETAQELLDAGIEVLTSGDHIFQQKSALQALENPHILRPLNYPEGTPGRGWTVVETTGNVKVAVVNLLGRVFMKPLDCPFRAIDAVLEEIYSHTRIIIVDMHAEATSEKIAMGWFLNGRVSAVCGTHTHVLTADARVLSEGTAYITDLGMTGAHESVLGRDIEPVLAHFKTGMPHRFKVADRNVRLNGALIDIDEQTGRARSIEIIQRNIESKQT